MAQSGYMLMSNTIRGSRPAVGDAQPTDRADLWIYQGDDFAAVATVYNEDGSVADITGSTARAQIRRAVADTDSLVVAEINVVVESPNITISLVHDVTATMRGQYVWDLQLTASDGTIVTILAGRVIVVQEVTRED